jgi:hypothetical protein
MCGDDCSKNLRGAQLVKEATKKPSFFADGIKKLVKLWNQCFGVEGNYVGK